MQTPLLLVTNDDGFDAPGLKALADALRRVGELWVVAPQQNQSAKSHALTLHEPLRIQERGERAFSVSGTPTDAMFVGLLHLLPRAPDLVFSGINRGANLGSDHSYSGTVAAALEGALRGIPSVALSHRDHEDPDYSDAAAFASQLAGRLLRDGLPTGSYLNVNFPAVPRGAVKGVRAASLGRPIYSNAIVRSEDPRGVPYYWIGGSSFRHEDLPGSDCNLIEAGYATITALRVDPTDHKLQAKIDHWDLP